MEPDLRHDPEVLNGAPSVLQCINWHQDTKDATDVIVQWQIGLDEFEANATYYGGLYGKGKVKFVKKNRSLRIQSRQASTSLSHYCENGDRDYISVIGRMLTCDYIENKAHFNS